MNFQELKKFNILFHVCVWLIVFSIPLLTSHDFEHKIFNPNWIIRLLLLMAFFYINRYYLIPKYLFAKQILTFTSWIILIFVSIILCDVYIDNHTQTERMAFKKNGLFLKRHKDSLESASGILTPSTHTEKNHPKRHIRKVRSRKFGGFNHRARVLPTFILTLLVFAISMSLGLASEYLKKDKQQKEMASEKLSAELSFLKLQISPHFLFNTLNNIYAMATTQSTNTAKAILKLSELMRYMLEETKSERVKLSEELEYIYNYIELQKLRIPESVEVKFSVAGNMNNKFIAPMLLIPFIENAFKHGISYTKYSYISIELKVSETEVYLNVSNSLHSYHTERDSISGIGLVNVERRLKLIYPDKHKLNIYKDEKNYYSELTIYS